MFRFRLDIAGEVQLDRGIARFADGVADYRPIWGVVEDDFYALEKDQFRSEGEEGGERWQELSPVYARLKAVRFPGKPILEATGELKGSLTSSSHPMAVAVRERKTLTLGSKVPYGIYHQSIEEREKLPRRPEIMLTEVFKRSVMHHLHGYVVQVATQSGFRQGLTPLTAAKLGALPAAWKGGFSPRRSADGGHWNF